MPRESHLCHQLITVAWKLLVRNGLQEEVGQVGQWFETHTLAEIQDKLDPGSALCCSRSKWPLSLSPHLPNVRGLGHWKLLDVDYHCSDCNVRWPHGGLDSPDPLIILRAILNLDGLKGAHSPRSRHWGRRGDLEGDHSDTSFQVLQW